jgi:hypothetical protein
VDVSPPDHHFEQEKSVLDAFLQLGCLVDDGPHNELLGPIARETTLTVLRDEVCRFLIRWYVPALDSGLVVSVVKVDTWLIELLHLEAIGE